MKMIIHMEIMVKLMMIIYLFQIIDLKVKKTRKMKVFVQDIIVEQMMNVPMRLLLIFVREVHHQCIQQQH